MIAVFSFGFSNDDNFHKIFHKMISYTTNLFLPSTYRFPLVSSTGWHKHIRVVLQTLANDSCCHDDTRGRFSGQYRDIPGSGVEPTELLCQMKRGTVFFLKIMCNFINIQSSHFIKSKDKNITGNKITVQALVFVWNSKLIELQ